VKRDERVKGARECTGEEGTFTLFPFQCSFSLLHLAPCPLPGTSLPSSSYSHGISVRPSVCLSVTCKIVTLAKRQELLTNGLDRFVATCLLYSEAKFRDKIPAGSYPTMTSKWPTVPPPWKKRFKTNRRLANCASYDSCYYVMQRRYQRVQGPGPHKKKIGPLRGAVARVFLNVSLAMCPLKLSLASVLATLWRQYLTTNRKSLCFPLVLGVYRGRGRINRPFLTPPF